jgi:hypothetical protein
VHDEENDAWQWFTLLHWPLMVQDPSSGPPLIAPLSLIEPVSPVLQFDGRKWNWPPELIVCGP